MIPGHTLESILPDPTISGAGYRLFVNPERTWYTLAYRSWSVTRQVQPVVLYEGPKIENAYAALIEHREGSVPSKEERPLERNGVYTPAPEDWK